MKKQFKYYVLCWIAALSVFNILSFIIPSGARFSKGFWIGYSFITLAFIGHLICTRFIFKKDSYKSAFYNIPLFYISYTSLVACVGVGTLCMIIPFIPYWLGITLCVITLGSNIIPAVICSASANIIEDTDRKVKIKTLFVRELTSDVEGLLSRAHDNDTKASIKKVYEAIRYSDPMSDDSLHGIEEQITLKYNELSNAVVSEDTALIKRASDEIILLMGDRNRRCRLMK